MNNKIVGQTLKGNQDYQEIAKRLVTTFEPQTSGHHTATRNFTSPKAADLFAVLVTSRWENTSFSIAVRYTKRGRFHVVSIINLTDKQYNEFPNVWWE